jgi:RNA polymerase sigma-70 factor (ECF subfamily)
MVTLPELDSEIGVLRFLKWKVRLLCLDVIRASGRAIINNIDEIAEPASTDAEVGSEMEHLEDAAIVRLALSKLNPRHREVLLASMYEEKSTREIASQVGLSENATLQLIFRARAAFKKALLGDNVDTSGMSVSAILSVAARKAAHEAQKFGAQAMVFVLFLILAVGAFVNIGNRNQQSVIAAGDRNTFTAAPKVTKAPTSTPASPETSKPVATASSAAALTAYKVASSRVESSPEPSPFNAAQVSRIYSRSAAAGVIRTASVSNVDGLEGFDVYDNLGNHAVVQVNNADAPTLQSALFDFTIDGFKYFAYLQDSQVSFTTVDGQQRMQLSGIVKLPFDASGKVWDQTSLAGTRVSLDMPFGSNVSKAASASLTVKAPNK